MSDETCVQVVETLELRVEYILVFFFCNLIYISSPCHFHEYDDTKSHFIQPRYKGLADLQRIRFSNFWNNTPAIRPRCNP